MEHKAAVVIPGGGSPYSEACCPVYQLIRDGGRRFGWDVAVLDYLRSGQGMSQPLGWLTFPKAVACAQSEMQPAERVIGLSFGVSVCASLAASGLLKTSQLIWYAPIPWEAYTRLYARPKDVKRINAEAALEGRGVRIAQSFLASLTPLEQLVRQMRGFMVTIVVGTKDSLTSTTFALSLIDQLRDAGNTARLHVVQGARHEMMEGNASEHVRTAYLEALFA